MAMLACFGVLRFEIVESESPRSDERILYTCVSPPQFMGRETRGFEAIERSSRARILRKLHIQPSYFVSVLADNDRASSGVMGEEEGYLLESPPLKGYGII